MLTSILLNNANGLAAVGIVFLGGLYVELAAEVLVRVSQDSAARSIQLSTKIPFMDRGVS